jgi:hypothetical protein
MTQSIEEVFREQPQESARLLHLHNGDITCETLERSDVPGTNRVWADVLHEGPVPADLAPHQFREMRVRFIAAQGWENYETALERYQRWDESLASFPEGANLYGRYHFLDESEVASLWIQSLGRVGCS